MLIAPLLAALSLGRPAPRPPALVVLVTVDQFAAFYVDRFRPQFTGGLARLLREGAVFTQAYQDQAITETAPGHAILLSGRYPASTGIASDALGVADPAAPALTGEGAGASPSRFQGTTLVDWLLARDARTRVLSVSMKDRGAILPIGRSRQAIFWYALDGTFTTSRFYADSLPGWLQRFNARQLARRTAGTSWTLDRPDGEYAEPDTVAWEGNSRDNTFPHAMPADSTDAANYVRATPAMDEITLALALEGVSRLELGTGPATDVLAVSLSATDVIGHRYGPDSREAHDNVLRLDRALGGFLDSLAVLRGASRIAVVLTADHGVASYPDTTRRAGAPDAPRHVTLAAELDSLRRWLQAQGAEPGAVALDNGALLADRGALAAAHVSVDSVADRFVRLAATVPGVLRAATFAALARADTVRDVTARRWQHAFPPGGIAVAVVTLHPGSVWGSRKAAEHGSPNDYDARVPLMLLGPWFRPGGYDRPVSLVDLAPTLAVITGVTPDARLDGRVLREALAEAP